MANSDSAAKTPDNVTKKNLFIGLVPKKAAADLRREPRQRNGQRQRG